jgi:hypothetical protein
MARDEGASVAGGLRPAADHVDVARMTREAGRPIVSAQPRPKADFVEQADFVRRVSQIRVDDARFVHATRNTLDFLPEDCVVGGTFRYLYAEARFLGKVTGAARDFAFGRQQDMHAPFGGLHRGDQAPYARAHDEQVTSHVLHCPTHRTAQIVRYLTS